MFFCVKKRQTFGVLDFADDSGVIMCGRYYIDDEMASELENSFRKNFHLQKNLCSV